MLPTQDNEMCESMGLFCIFFMFPTRVALMWSARTQNRALRIVAQVLSVPNDPTNVALRLVWSDKTASGLYSAPLSLLNGRLVL